MLVGRTLSELVAAMERPRLSSGVLAGMAGGRATIWLSPSRTSTGSPLATSLQVTASGPRVRRWLRPETCPETRREAAEVMRDAITPSRGSATRGHAGATFALSGGLDSTTLLALAARNPPIRPGLRAYCAVPEPRSVARVRGK